MPDYAYKAINQSGEDVSGVVKADSVEMAGSMLSAQGYIPVKVVEEGAISTAGWWKRIETKLGTVRAEELILFTKQFRTMLIAGMPILKLLEILENQTENRKLKNVILSIALDIREGLSLYDAFSKRQGIFSPLYCSMIMAGENSGTLPEVLGRLVYILEHEHKVKSDIKAAMQYPLIVLAALGVAFFVLLTFVIPKFVGIFSRADIELPLPTAICILTYNFLSHYWGLIICGVVIIITALMLYKKTEDGKHLFDKLILETPVVGAIIVKSVMSRFASVFSILQSSGVPVLSSLGILSGTIGNQAIVRQFNRVRNGVKEGQGISGPLKSAKYFTPMVVDMIAIGEESGSLEEMLREISVHYDDEVEYAIRGLSAMIGPILIVAIAVVVGFFALSIFLPMWDLTKVARKGF